MFYVQKGRKKTTKRGVAHFLGKGGKREAKNTAQRTHEAFPQERGWRRKSHMSIFRPSLLSQRKRERGGRASFSPSSSSSSYIYEAKAADDDDAASRLSPAKAAFTMNIVFLFLRKRGPG